MCHIHRATAWTSQATNGIVSVRQTRFIEASFARLPRLRDQFRGSAHRKAISGRPRTRSGAATSIKTSCCDMWAEDRTRPHACTGETRATKSASHPPAKQSASHVRIDLRLGDSRHSRRKPTANKTAETVSETVIKGSKLHARARS